MKVLLLVSLLVALASAMGYPRGRARRSASASVCQDKGVDKGEPLLLTPYLKNNQLQAGRQAARAMIDGVDLGYSGFFSVPSASGQNTNNMFTWFMPCTRCKNVSEAPLLLWQQGGPGANDPFGSLNEIGPLFVDSNCTLRKRTYTWCDPFASCIFIDNPVQTGFSYQLNASGQFDPDHIEYTRTSADAGVQVTGVLQQLLQLFPEVASAPFWITGESYGGNYVANTALAILEHAPEIELQGVSVGDPVMNQVEQWPTYADTLYGMGLLSIAQREKIRSVMAEGVQQLLAGNCVDAFNLWNSVWNDDGAAPTPFYYQQFTGSSTTYESLLTVDPPVLAYSSDWLGTSQVAAAMHFGGIPSVQLNEGGPVYSTMVASGDFCQNSSALYAQLLERGIHVQIYSSTNDPLLGPPCTEAGVMALLDSAGLTADFLAAPRNLWRDGELLNGYATCFESKARFCYTVTRGAGHMQPSFTPRASTDMTMRFILGTSFSGPPPATLPPPGPQCGGMPPFTGSADCACHV